MSTNTQGMSPEEAALTDELDGEGLPAELASEIANRESLQKPETDDDASDDEPSAAPAPAPAPAANAPAAPAAPAPAPAAAITPDDEAPEATPYSVDVPADVDDQLKALKTEYDEAFATLMSGDMTEEAYRKIADRTQAAAKELEAKVLTANVLSEMSQQQAATDWKRAQATEFAAFKGDGLDYGKPALLAAYNVNLKTLAAVPENENRSARWFLREAHRLTKADLGMAASAPAPAPAPAARGVDRTLIPPTLARTPPAVDPTVAGDEFAHMGSLSGAAAERAYANMTPEQQERYLDT